jgi:hypothetical protein
VSPGRIYVKLESQELIVGNIRIQSDGRQTSSASGEYRHRRKERHVQHGLWFLNAIEGNTHRRQPICLDTLNVPEESLLKACAINGELEKREAHGCLRCVRVGNFIWGSESVFVQFGLSGLTKPSPDTRWREQSIDYYARSTQMAARPLSSSGANDLCKVLDLLEVYVVWTELESIFNAAFLVYERVKRRSHSKHRHIQCTVP